jgi:acyl-CoA synthetase (NDP forming)
VDRPDGSAEAVAALLRPRSIAIVGASEKSRWSHGAFDNLTRSGFAGELHLVNRRGGKVHGRDAAASCAAVGAPIDLGIVLVPAPAVAEAIDDLGAAGVRSAVILTSGFAETGATGAALQADVADRARRHGIRLLGPNSLGFANFAGNARVWTTPVRAPSRRDGVAVVSQSGATAFFLAELAYQQDLGLSYVVATGNEVDLDASAFVDFLVDDPHTRAIALFVETVRDPAAFLAAARRALHARKPIVVLKVGASEVTAKSAAAHTGALVGDDRVFDGLCRQLGMIRVHSIEALLATADIAGRTGVLRQGGLGIVSNSGGICEIAADAAQAAGIGVPELRESVAARLRDAMPGFGTPHNPLDLTGGIEPAQCGRAVRMLGEEPAFAAILCAWYAIPTCAEEESPRLAELHRELSKGLNETPVPGLLVSYTPGHVNDRARRLVAEYQAPYFAFGLDRAIEGLAGVFRWSERQRTLRPTPGAALPQISGERPSSERAALEFLARHGVPVVPATLATDEAQAIAAARSIGGPVVLKIASPDIAHKSDIGAVALNVEGERAVGAVFRRIMDAARTHAPAAKLDGVLVSPMRERGIELIVGVSRDPQWGPVLAVGLGGVWVEVLRDASLRVLPVDTDEIRRMLTGLRGAKLLAGQRGVPAADLDAVAGAIARIAEAALALGPALAEMDVNPLWVRGVQVEALDALFVWQEPRG